MKIVFKMGEKAENQTVDVDMNNFAITFDNLTILKEFSNISNLVSNEDFLEIVPKVKLGRVKWMSLLNCLKQGLMEEMVQELSSLWEYENMTSKLEALEKQKEKFQEEDNSNKQLWRPQLGDVKAQLKAYDVANLQKQKVLIESLAREYETRVNKLMNIITAKRGYLRVLQMDIQKYQRNNDDVVTKINNKLENHQNLVKMMIPMDIDENAWTDKELEINK